MNRTAAPTNDILTALPPKHKNGAWRLFRIEFVAHAVTDLLMIGEQKTALLGSLKRHSWPAPVKAQ
jgi:hypothetical protein